MPAASTQTSTARGWPSSRGRLYQRAEERTRSRDDYATEMYASSQKYLRAAQAQVREKKNALDLLLANLQLIAPLDVTIAAEDLSDVLHHGKPIEDQLSTFIIAARQDLGAD
jgi:hypothetical protein